MMDDQLDSFMESHLNGNYGDILDEQTADEFAEEYDEEFPFDEPWDDILQQQELEDFEQADEYFGFFGYDEF
ncbi:MAG: hypothetical protein CME33_25570 [Gimesia sp.]|uniref:hypothetical protein n=1 Tax=Gimesia sp. TaxID=2024833 RepID=UPI000C48B7E3|nr:hypothetical protein [Gimesia sp.]MAX39927.1 hypothetical protein [Gimesia sp.]|tara:strand:+ start:1471 stop:1686 length:216 start_codon:yes stop_codon:yes gene_type:complete